MLPILLLSVISEILTAPAWRVAVVALVLVCVALQ